MSPMMRRLHQEAAQNKAAKEQNDEIFLLCKIVFVVLLIATLTEAAKHVLFN